MTTTAEELTSARLMVDALDPFTDGATELKTALQVLVGALERVHNDRHSAATAMSRSEALEAARAHVEAMSTNSRGYQDGVKLSDKVQAMETFARFLMGEGE